MRLSRGNRELILNGSLVRAVLAIALPVIANSFLQTLYNLTDTYWLGRIGTEPLAAINLVTPMQNIVINFGSGLTTAGAVLIAQLIGAGDDKRASRMASQILFCALLFAVVSAGALSLLSPAIVAWLGAEGLTYQSGVDYLRIVILDMPFLFLVNIFQAVNQAQGNTVRPMVLNLSGIGLNLVLDPLLMVHYHLGAVGAALATVLAKAVPALIALYLLTNPREPVRVGRQWMKPEKENLRAIIKIGLPTALGGSAMQFGFLLMSRTVNTYGVQAMAAYGVGNKINGLITLPSNAIGSATATIVGQNMGARKIERAKKGYLISMGMAVSFLFIGGLVMGQKSISTAIVRLFAQEEEVIRLAADFQSLMATWCFFNGVYNATTGLFQGSGHTEITMASDASRLWVYRFATLYFCRHVLRMGVESVWYSVVVSNAIAALVLLLLYFTGIWKKNRVKIQK
ncbi:MAG: MATE family efflux transporter [Clostridia bacterium]|nr:MATE family efflux transporter [Clostridia bacterium]